MKQVLAMFNIDSHQFFAIVEARKQSLKNAQAQGDNSHSGGISRFLLQLVLYFLAGASASTGLLFGANLSGMTLVYSVLMMVMGVSFISHLSAQWLTDKQSDLLRRFPVSPRTLFASQLAVDAYFIANVSIATAFPCVLAVWYTFGWASAGYFFLSVILIILFLIMVSQLLCLSTLWGVRVGQVKNMLLYGLLLTYTAIIFLANLVIERFNQSAAQLHTLVDMSGIWMWFYPPSWMAGMFVHWQQAASDPLVLQLAVLGWMIPLAGLALTTWWFTVKASRIREFMAQHASDNQRKHKPARAIWLNTFCPTPTQRAYFQFVVRMMLTDRQFRLKVFPNIGMMIALLLTFLYQHYGVGAAELMQRPAFFFLSYLMASFLVMSMIHLKYSEHNQAAWLLNASPLSQPADATLASLKAFWLIFLMPANGLIILVFVAVWGVQLLPHFLVTAMVATLLAIRQCWAVKLSLPFSLDVAADNQSGLHFTSMFSMFPPMILMGVGHYLAQWIGGIWGVLMFAIVVLLVGAMAYRRLAALSHNRSLHNVKAEHVSWIDE